MPTVTLYFEHDIIATATRKVIRRGVGMYADVIVDLKDRETMKNHVLAQRHFDTLAKEKAKSEFIFELRNDTALKRTIGGTKWEVQLRAPSTVHPTSQQATQFYKDLIFGRANRQDNMEIMLSSILDSLGELSQALVTLDREHHRQVMDAREKA